MADDASSKEKVRRTEGISDASHIPGDEILLTNARKNPFDRRSDDKIESGNVKLG